MARRSPWIAAALVLAFAGAELLRVHLHFRGEAHTITLCDLVLVLALIFDPPLEVVLAQLLGSARWPRAVADLATALDVDTALAGTVARWLAGLVFQPGTAGQRQQEIKILAVSLSMSR